MFTDGDILMKQETLYDDSELRAVLSLIADYAPDTQIGELPGVPNNLISVYADACEASEGRLVIRVAPTPAFKRFAKSLQSAT